LFVQQYFIESENQEHMPFIFSAFKISIEDT